jgi:hypothetical protein
MNVNGFLRNMPIGRIFSCCIMATFVLSLMLYSSGCGASTADSADKDVSGASAAAISEAPAESSASAIDTSAEATSPSVLWVCPPDTESYKVFKSGSGSKQLFVTNELGTLITALSVRHTDVKKFGGGIEATDMAWYSGDGVVLQYDIPAPSGDATAATDSAVATTDAATAATGSAVATTDAATAATDSAVATTGTATTATDSALTATGGGQKDLYDIRLTLSDESKITLHAVDFDASEKITVKSTDGVAFISFVGADGKEISTYEAEKAVQQAAAEAKAKKAEAKEAEAKAKAEAEKEKAASYKPPAQKKKKADDECVDDIILRP